MKEFNRILKPQGRLVIVELIRRSFFVGAPVQKPEVLTPEVEAGGFKLRELIPYKVFGVFCFIKKGA